MSNSSLVSYTKIVKNSNPRKYKITKITIHHMAGNLSLSAVGNVFASRGSSANYAVDSNGKIGMYVEEKDRSWCSSNADNDHRAVTIEVANDGGASTKWHVSDKALEATIELCVDICKRNGIEKLNFTGNKNGNLTMHCYFAATACPGSYLKSKFQYIADEVNKRLGASATTSKPVVESTTSTSGLYKVQVGAFKNENNAVDLAEELEDKGFDTYIVEEGGLHKVQTGAFGKKENADALAKKLKDAGYSVYIKKPTTVASTKTETVKKEEVVVIDKNDVVKVKKGAKTYTGEKLLDFVYTRNHKVKEVDGDRVVITYGGVVVAAVKMSDLTLIKKA